MVTINGEARDAAGKTLAAYLEAEGYPLTRVAVERNGDIVPKAASGETILQEGDTLEVVRFVGGG